MVDHSLPVDCIQMMQCRSSSQLPSIVYYIPNWLMEWLLHLNYDHVTRARTVLCIAITSNGLYVLDLWMSFKIFP